ncbi:TetR family transcriptional regulator [Comamonas testosteroni]|uniref:TetR family transcriptional regulator n=1 Tax=Comamonas testosteroni TaxID=285 RepID=A0A0L7MDP4_COMTE|nr:TetR family transcriptional regulator [Comamonas testosteroni]
MARPRSEEKQQALLRAATEIFAEQGLAAPTAAIAKKAGVAEGTLFRYFENKSVLVSAVCDSMLDEVERFLAKSLVGSSPGRSQSQVAWDAYIDWALANPASHAAGNILMVSSKMSEAQMERTMRLSDIALQGTSLVKGLDQAQSIEFLSMICTGMMNAVIDMAVRKPHMVNIYKHAGYQAMLQAIEVREST